MNVRSRKYLKFIILMAIWPVIPSGNLFAQTPDQALHLKWNAVEGAVEYRVEIVDPKLKPVFTAKTAATRVEFSLPPGDYHYRLASVDKLGRVSDWSTWDRLRVLPVRPPALEDKSPQTFEIHGTRNSILLRGRFFLDDSVIVLRDRAGREVPIQSRERLTNGRMRIFIDKSQAKPGSYDLILKNPRGPQTIIRDYLRIPVPPEKVYNYWQPLVPGVYQLRRDEKLKGGLFLGAAIGLAAGAGYNWWRGNALLNEKKGDILLNFYTNPVLFYAFQTTLKNNISQHTLAAEFYFVRGSQLSNEIAVHRSNYNALRAALGILYVIHISDILGFGKDVANNYTPGELSRPIVTGAIAGSNENPFAVFSVSFQF